MRGQTLTKKELVNVGHRPIIWHVMRIFSAFGFNRFVLTLGYQAEQIKRYFLEYELLSRDFRLSLNSNVMGKKVDYLSDLKHPAWDIYLADTGLHTEKASRINRVRSYLDKDRFFVAYGDDVSDVNLHELLDFHITHGKTATITAVQIELPYGIVRADSNGLVQGFEERPRLDLWINGGFMLFERSALDFMLNGDDVSLEHHVLPALAEQGELMIYKHIGFWQSMNTMKDNILLEELWRTGAPWKIW